MWQPRNIKKSAQALSHAESLAILDRNFHGTMATADGNGYPLAIPFYYVCLNGNLYIHCGKSGHSLDSIKAQNRVSFCVVDEAVPEYVDGTFTLYYKSVVVNGIASVVDDLPESRRVMAEVCQKTAPGHEKMIAAAIDASFAGVTVIRIKPEQISGKFRKSMAPPNV